MSVRHPKPADFHQITDSMSVAPEDDLAGMGNGEEPGTFSSARANRMVGFFDFVFILFPCNCMHENAPFIRKRRRNGHPEITQLGNEALNEAEEMNHRASGVFRRCLIPE